MSGQRQAEQVSSGVEALLERLREEGAEKGRRQAEKIVSDAEHRAGWLLDQARQEAEQIIAKARQQAQRTEDSLSEALKIAVRDAVLSLKSTLTGSFAREVQEAVRGEMHKSEVLRQLILQVAGRAVEPLDSEAQVCILLPRHVVGLVELREHPSAFVDSPLTELAGFIARDLVKSGVTFRIGREEQVGIKLLIGDEGMELDLTDEAIANLLLAHLQPRFRAMVEGIIR